MGKFYFKNIKYILRTLIKKARTEAGQKEIRMNFDEKLKNSKGIDGIIKKLKVMYYYFMDPEVPIYKKAIIGAVLLYFINPADVIPDIVPLSGFIDDTFVVVYGWNLLKNELEQYIETKRSGVVDQDGEVILDVEYTVGDNE